MARRRAIPVGRGGIVHTAFTGVADGDLRVTLPPEQLAPRRAAIAPGEWTWLDQVHGADVVRVGAPGQHAGAPADAAVTDVPNAVLAVHTADCAGVLLWGTGDGVVAVGAAHAGWRGLHDGVLESTVAELRALGAVDVHYCLGPCISPGSYEFGEEDLDRLVTRFGPGVASRWSAPPRHGTWPDSRPRWPCPGRRPARRWATCTRWSPTAPTTSA